MLLLGVVLWSYVTEVTSRSVTILVGNAGILRKVAIPRIALPLSVALTGGIIMLLNLLAVLVFILISNVEVTASWLWMLPLLAQLVAFPIGVSLILSIAFVSLRDIGQVWEVLLQLLFYATPIIYPLSMVPQDVQRYLLINPFAQIIQQSREAVVGPQAGRYVDAMPGLWLYVPYAITAIVVAGGIMLYQRRISTIAEQL
jgi:ABC-2 type transport system permease protein